MTGEKKSKLLHSLVHSQTWEENVQRWWKFRRDGAWIVLFGSREIRTAEMIFHPFAFNWKVIKIKQKKAEINYTSSFLNKKTSNKWKTKQGPHLKSEMGIKRGRALDDFVPFSLSLLSSQYRTFIINKSSYTYQSNHPSTYYYLVPLYVSEGKRRAGSHTQQSFTSRCRWDMETLVGQLEI